MILNAHLSDHKQRGKVSFTRPSVPNNHPTFPEQSFAPQPLLSLSLPPPPLSLFLVRASKDENEQRGGREASEEKEKERERGGKQGAG